MKRCLFIFHSVGGGAETVACTLASHLDRDAFSPVIASMRYLPELLTHIPGDMRVIMPRNNSTAQWIKNCFAVWKAARESDAVIGTVELQSIFFAALFAQGKAIGWLHKDLGPYFAMRRPAYRTVYRAALNWAAGRCRHVVCVSDGVAERCNRIAPASRGKIRFMLNPIDTESVRAKSKESLPEILEQCFTKPVILGVGRLASEKAFHLLIKAHALLLERGIDHNLCILGEGPERPFLTAAAGEHGVAASFFLPGSMNPFPAMKRAVALGMSSAFEGLPTVIIESMALGLPVVSMDCPSGPRFLLDEGRCGVLTPEGDARALADGLQTMFESTSRERYAAAALERAAMFSLLAAVEAWERLLEQD